MKYTIIAVLLLITVSKGVAQTFTNLGNINSATIMTIKAKEPAACMRGSDTLEIMEPLQIHYIKIGNEVYQLVPHNTTIEKAPPLNTGIIQFWPNGTITPTYLNGSKAFN